MIFQVNCLPWGGGGGGGGGIERCISCTKKKTICAYFENVTCKFR